MAKATKKLIGYEGGREESLTALGRFFLIIGICGFVAAFIAAGLVTRGRYGDSWAENGLSGAWITVGIVSLIQGIAANVFSKSFADVIRLLKKQNGLPYGGEISAATPLHQFTCSKCGSVAEMMLQGGNLVAADRCQNCGVIFEPAASESDEQNS
jgi:hypothetical protein